MSRIGIMGGTFNPIHQGHLMLAQKAYEQFNLDKVLVIPNKLPAYKEQDELLDSRQRSRMVQLAIDDFPYMEFSDLELTRSGATYTIDTLQELKQKYPNDKLYFILGGDSLMDLHKWRAYQDILTLAVILCARRNDADIPELEQAKKRLLHTVPTAEIYIMDTPMMDISSTEIRDHLQAGDQEPRWVPEAVLTFIQEHHLYTDETTKEETILRINE